MEKKHKAFSQNMPSLKKKLKTITSFGNKKLVGVP
uniref:Uncharacterized protein n=1 Tax=Rhizophora mucronata TaxID=61149 RepID=A0A2P2NMB2_RHIMU